MNNYIIIQTTSFKEIHTQCFSQFVSAHVFETQHFLQFYSSAFCLSLHLAAQSSSLCVQKSCKPKTHGFVWFISCNQGNSGSTGCRARVQQVDPELPWSQEMSQMSHCMSHFLSDPYLFISKKKSAWTHQSNYLPTKKVHQSVHLNAQNILVFTLIRKKAVFLLRCFRAALHTVSNWFVYSAQSWT